MCIRLQDPLVRRIVQAIVARAFECIKVELMCLVSLGILYLADQDRDKMPRGVSDDSKMDSETFDLFVLQGLTFKMRVKINRKVATETDLRKHWAYVVAVHIKKSVTSVNSSLRHIATEKYLEKAPHCYANPLLPPLNTFEAESIESVSLVDDSDSSQNIKPRKMKRRKTSAVDGDMAVHSKRRRKNNPKDEPEASSIDHPESVIPDDTGGIGEGGMDGEHSVGKEVPPGPPTVRKKFRYQVLGRDDIDEVRYTNMYFQRVCGDNRCDELWLSLLLLLSRIQTFYAFCCIAC